MQFTITYFTVYRNIFPANLHYSWFNFYNLYLVRWFSLHSYMHDGMGTSNVIN